MRTLGGECFALYRLRDHPNLAQSSLVRTVLLTQRPPPSQTACSKSNPMNIELPKPKLTYLLVIACLALVSAALAVDPPPDGGYPVENTAEGEDALFSLLPTNLGGNTAVGFQALYSNTTGSDNTAVGDEALHAANTAGSANTALGSWALHENTTATENTAIGGFSLVNNITGESNVVIGFEARKTQSSGFGNVVIGVRSSGGGSDNVAIGDRAMGNTDKGDENVALGESALSYCTGSYNIALGTVAGRAVNY